MSWDGTVVEDVGPPRAKPTGSGKVGVTVTTPKVTEEKQPTKVVTNHHKETEEKIPVVSQPVVHVETSKPSLAVAPTESKQRKLVAMYAYDATEDGELTFDEGAVILVVSENESGWWRGRLDTGAEGLFPSNFMMSEAESAEKMAEMGGSSVSTPAIQVVSAPVSQPVQQEPAPVVIEPEPADEPKVVSTGGVPVEINASFVAMYDYDAEDDTEMTIHEGDVLFVVSETDGWYLGNNQSGQTGNFPSNFVQRKEG